MGCCDSLALVRAVVECFLVDDQSKMFRSNFSGTVILLYLLTIAKHPVQELLSRFDGNNQWRLERVAVICKEYVIESFTVT